jgi:hypothetical protein
VIPSGFPRNHRARILGRMNHWQNREYRHALARKWQATISPPNHQRRKIHAWMTPTETPQSAFVSDFVKLLEIPASRDPPRDFHHTLSATPPCTRASFPHISLVRHDGWRCVCVSVTVSSDVCVPAGLFIWSVPVISPLQVSSFLDCSPRASFSASRCLSASRTASARHNVIIYRINFTYKSAWSGV